MSSPQRDPHRHDVQRIDLHQMYAETPAPFLAQLIATRAANRAQAARERMAAPTQAHPAAPAPQVPEFDPDTRDTSNDVQVIDVRAFQAELQAMQEAQQQSGAPVRNADRQSTPTPVRRIYPPARQQAQSAQPPSSAPERQHLASSPYDSQPTVQHAAAVSVPPPPPPGAQAATGERFAEVYGAMAQLCPDDRLRRFAVSRAFGHVSEHGFPTDRQALTDVVRAADRAAQRQGLPSGGPVAESVVGLARLTAAQEFGAPGRREAQTCVENCSGTTGRERDAAQQQQQPVQAPGADVRARLAAGASRFAQPAQPGAAERRGGYLAR